MSSSLYELESSMDNSRNREARIVFMVSAMYTMTCSFLFCAFVISMVLGGAKIGWTFLILSILKAALLVGAMVFASTLIAQFFETPTIRRINALFLGLVLAVSFAIFSL